MQSHVGGGFALSSIAHIVHPVVVAPSSDLVVAQPITFETMHVAGQFARGTADVRLYAVQYADEQRLPLPASFARTPDLRRCVADIAPFRKRRKLALIRDILEALYAATDAEYLVYTNVDIALQPHFYSTVARLIAHGHDALVINRRTIPAHWRELADLPLMWAEPGEPHPGWDCFVFRRDLYPRFDLGHACIGTDWIGRMMITNMAALARQFAVFGDLHATFHVGDDRAWRSDEFSDYAEHNRSQCQAVLERFDRELGPFDRTTYPGRFFSHLDPSTRSGQPVKLFANLVLVGGPPRSGTTLLARSLGRHPQVVTPLDNHVHECRALYDYARRCGLVAELRSGHVHDPKALRQALRHGLLHDGAMHIVPSGKTAGSAAVPPPGAGGSALASLQDETLLRHHLPLERFQPGWRLCLKSPEITFVLPGLAALFGQARFVLVHRSAAEVAESMFRMGNTVRRMPVYHARWKQEGEPPPGVPAQWHERWDTGGDFDRCVLYASAYLLALADGAGQLGRGRVLLLDHAELRRHPRQAFHAVARHLEIETAPLEAEAKEVRPEAAPVDLELRSRADALTEELGLGSLARRLSAMTLHLP